jgi:hypothetical protein
VTQVSPSCAGIGHFSVVGHAGLNRVRFTGKVHGRRLAPGTYRISIRTASGRVVRRVTLVVVGSSVAPSGDELQALRSANACPDVTTTAQIAFAAAPFVSAGVAGGVAGVESTAPLASAKVPQNPAAAGLLPTKGPNLHSGVLASSVEKTARAIQPFLVALLALSILLLGTASMPREALPGPRLHDALARHRLELAALGAAALVAVALAFLLS